MVKSRGDTVGVLSSVKSFFGNLFKSAGERRIVSLMPGWNIAGRSGWSSNRHELVQHFKGWNYICIRTIAETGADMPPQVARVVKGQDAHQARQKAWFSSRDPWQRAKALSEAESLWLPRSQRRKAIVAVAENDELEQLPDDDRMVRLLSAPNPVDKFWWMFAYRMFMYLEQVGGFYLYDVPGGDGLPAELWCIPPNWVYPVGGDGRFVKEYEIRPVIGYAGMGGDMAAGWMGGGALGGAGIKFSADQITQIGYPNPMHYLDFYSPISAVEHWVDAAENMDRSRIAVFQNDNFPGVVITMDKDAESPDQATVDRLKADIKAKYTGVLKTGEPAILGPGITMTRMSATNVEMDYANSWNQMAEALRAVHKVGPGMLGMSESTTLAGAVAEKINFHQNCMKPKFSLIGQGLTRIARKFGADRVVYWPDPTPDDPAQVNQDIDTDVRAGARTPNEIRRKRGLDPYQFGGDDPIMPMGVSPMPMGTGMDAEDVIVPALEDRHEEEQEQPDMGGLPGMLGGKPEQNGKPQLNGKPSVNGNGHHSTLEKPLAEMGKRWSGNGWARHEDLGAIQAEIADIRKRFDVPPAPPVQPVHHVVINNHQPAAPGLPDVVVKNEFTIPEQKPADIHFNPTIQAAEQPQIVVNVPEQKTPSVTVQNLIPEQAAPVVNVTNRIPQQPAPVVNIEPTPLRDMIFERDENGELIRSRQVESGGV